MGKLKKSDTVEDTCPSVDHDQAASESAPPKSDIPKKSRTAMNSDKPRKSNRGKTDVSHESLATLKAAKTENSRRSRSSRKNEEACRDTEHESSSIIKPKDSKKLESSSKFKKSRYSNDTEEACPNTDHYPTMFPDKSTETKNPQEPSEPAECGNSDHRESVDSHKSSKSQTELLTSEKEARRASSDQKRSKAKNMVDNLKMSKIAEDIVPQKTKKDREENYKKERKLKAKERKDEEKQQRDKIKNQNDKEKKDKKSKKTGKSSPGEDDCDDTDHWLSFSDAKKLKKLIKSREEKVKKSIEPKKSKSKGKGDPTDSGLAPEHALSQCDVVRTNDGAASRKASRPDQGATPKRTPAQAFPRGIQIMAKNTNTLEGGFPYPKELTPFGITKEDWAVFCHKLTEPLASKSIAYAIEKILDICAEEDVKFFRPNGFIMRVDMPGEEQYGLDIMDIYHPKPGSIHTDNFATIPPHSKEFSGVIKHHHHIRKRTKDRKHLETLRDEAFRSTRLILDPVIVLKDPELATKRGWARWIIACNQAQKLAEEAPPKRIDNKPWYGYFPARWDRWPPSKHLYYDRFRGSSHTIGSKSSPSAWLIPDYDSMDQRGTPYTSTVIPCDEVEFAVLHPDQP